MKHGILVALCCSACSWTAESSSVELTELTCLANYNYKTMIGADEDSIVWVDSLFTPDPFDVYRMSLDGDRTEVFAVDFTTFNAITLDEQGDIYWGSEDFQADSWAIGRIGKDGSEEELLVRAKPIHAVVRHDDLLFWIEGLWRDDLADYYKMDLSSREPVLLGSIEQQVGGYHTLAVGGGQLFTNVITPEVPGVCSIASFDLRGPSEPGFLAEICAGGSYPLLADDEHLYYLNGGSLVRGRHDGSDISTLAVIPVGITADGLSRHRVVLTDSHVVFALSGGRIDEETNGVYSVAKKGGAVRPLFGAEGIRGLVVGAGELFVQRGHCIDQIGLDAL